MVKTAYSINVRLSRLHQTTLTLTLFSAVFVLMGMVFIQVQIDALIVEQDHGIVVKHAQ